MNISAKENILYINGSCTIADVDFSFLKKEIHKVNKNDIYNLDLQNVDTMDSTGAYIILNILIFLDLNISNCLEISQTHLDIINKTNKYYQMVLHDKEVSTENNTHTYLYNKVFMIGHKTNNLISEIIKLICFLGAIFRGYWFLIRKPYKGFLHITLDIIHDSTIKALGIVVLLSLIIGLVLTYLPLNLMMQYGTQIFVVDMLGISSFREFAPLFTAIIIAGRSGSAFTSEIGLMKVNEEIDALKTIGEDPIQRLILPRITALMVSLPVLTVIAMIANIIGGMFITYLFADITPVQFINRLFSNVSINNYCIGLLKTPFFAIVIAGIGCLEGINVKRDARSVGAATTTSVVYSIFLIIVVDAIFAIALGVS